MSHYKAYPEYKESGVKWIGSVPEHWELTRFKYVSELNPKKSTITTERNELCTFLPMEKLKTDTIILDETRVIDEVYDGYSYFADDDILIAKVTPCFENKNIAVAKGLVNGVGFGSTEINTIRAKANANNRFLYYRLQEDQFLKIAISEMTGSGGLKRVPSELFQIFKFAIPSYEEQALIAAQIDKENQRIHTLITKKTRFIELLKEKRQALITHAVTKGLNPHVKMKDSGVEWIGEVPEHWQIAQLRRLVSINNGSDHKAIEADEGFPVYGSGGAFAYATDYIYDGESVLLGRKGTIDKPLYVNEKFWTVDTMYWTKIMPIANGKFCYYVAKTIPFDYYASNTALPSMTQTDLGSHVVAFPDKVEQSLIASALDRETSRIDTLISKTLKSISLLKERRSAFITAAVTGQIDLRGEPV
ncbi:restriction endonuclease subunit S [Vibrio metschnikovii]|jgi:type I restriction enzyme S subunit|nr:restriction endonuclease subunit S [Vibrio metschnikovii]